MYYTIFIDKNVEYKYFNIILTFVLYFKMQFLIFLFSFREKLLI
jgi:hypothetical protein